MKRPSFSRLRLGAYMDAVALLVRAGTMPMLALGELGQYKSRGKGEG